MHTKSNKAFSRRKLVFHTIVLIISSVITGILLLCLVYMLPTERMKKNVAAAYDLFMDERVYHDWSNDVEYTRLDGYTDMIMYGTAIYPRGENILEEALLCRHFDMLNEDGMDVAYWSTDKSGEYEATTYEVYWHGYLIWLKPLLLILHPRNIRVLNMILQFLLIAYLFKQETIVLKGKFFLPLAIGLIIMNTVSTAMCLQFSSIFYISIIAMILMLKFPSLVDGRHCFSIFFLMIGICVAYFDFLTYPPVALCMPLLLYLLLRRENTIIGHVNKSEYATGWRNVITEDSMSFSVIRAGIYWTVGYVTMWGSKWILPLVVGDNRLDYVLYELGYRSGMGDVAFNQVLVEKIKVLMIKPFIILFFVYFVYIVTRFVAKSFTKSLTFLEVDYIFALLMVMIIPFAWYYVVREHSLHTFAYRELGVSIMAAVSLFESFFNKK